MEKHGGSVFKGAHPGNTWKDNMNAQKAGLNCVQTSDVPIEEELRTKDN